MHISIIPPKGKEIVVPKTSECLMIHGRDLLYYMYQELDIVACKDYFGLTYCGGKDGKLRWLEEDDQMRRLEQSLGRKMTFQVAESCHPEEPEETFGCRSSRRLFRDLIKEKLLKGQLGCEVELHAELDAIILQTEQGVLPVVYFFVILSISLRQPGAGGGAGVCSPFTFLLVHINFVVPKKKVETFP